MLREAMIFTYLFQTCRWAYLPMRQFIFILILFFPLITIGRQIEMLTLNGLDDGVLHSVIIKVDPIVERTEVFIEKDNLILSGVQDLVESKIHSQNFLELKFRVRGGSGVKVRRSVLLCISQSKLHRSIDVLCEITSNVSTVYNKIADSLKLFNEVSEYSVSLDVMNSSDKDFIAIILEKKNVQSKFDPSQDISYENRLKLNFDASGNYFYNYFEILNGDYKVFLNKSNAPIKRFVSGRFPCIKLRDTQYLYIDNQWFLNDGHWGLSSL